MENLTIVNERTSTNPGVFKKSKKILAKVLEFGELASLREQFPSSKIVHCHGVFDVLHAGHLAYFESAKKFGDILVVTLTADQHVNKGPGRPYFNSSIRSKMISALETVDFVAVNHFPTAVPAIETLKPDFYVKGPDYKDKSTDPTGAIFDEEEAARKGGGKLVFTDDETFSSSALINQFFNPWTEAQTKAIEAVKSAGGLETIIQVLDRVQKLDVTLIGEPIVDTYIFCQPEALSSKSPSISAKFLYEENYAGGTLAIANHLADFVNQVTMISTHGGETYFNELIKDRIDPKVNLIAQEIANSPTPRKTRYIEKERNQRMFELTDVRADQWERESPREFCGMILKNNREADLNRRVTLLCDFGHGLFEGSVLEAASALHGFIGLNVQTNSSNLGFNPFNKHKRFSYLSIDTREARIAYHDRFSAAFDLARRISKDIAPFGASFSMTLGHNGAVYFPAASEGEVESAAFSDSVVDATGAGDAYFALSSMLVKVGCPDPIVPFLGNVFAGLKTKIIGNKTSVTRAQLVKAVSAILK